MNGHDERNRAKERNVEVGDVEEVNFRLSDEGREIQLFLQRIEWKIEN